VPIFLVRWPDLTAALVRAPNEAAASLILDELADPSSASIERYDGPIWIEFGSPQPFTLPDGPIEGTSVADVVVATDWIDPERGCGQFLHPAGAGAETGEEMLRAMVQRAFPRVAQALEAIADDPAAWRGEGLSGDKQHESLVRDAVRTELAPLFSYRWRAAATNKRNPTLGMLGLAEPLPTEEADEPSLGERALELADELLERSLAGLARGNKSIRLTHEEVDELAALLSEAAQLDE
jgi:hypothetical protein